jgi:hypothetical protein
MQLGVYGMCREFVCMMLRVFAKVSSHRVLPLLLLKVNKVGDLGSIGVYGTLGVPSAKNYDFTFVDGKVTVE